MRSPAFAWQQAHPVALRALVRSRSSLLLTSSGPHRPTTFGSVHAQRYTVSSASRDGQTLCSLLADGRRRANSLAVGERLVVSNPQRPPNLTRPGYARRDRQCRPADDQERVTLSCKEMNRLAVQAVLAGCRHVVSCPILDTAGLALRPPYGGFPSPLRASAPRAGRRLFWAASLAPTTTKQEEQQ